MNWNNVSLIVSREVRDQLRDRRTIFVIAILPLLLYPLLGMTFLQVAQFMKEHPTTIWVIGAERLPAEPALLDGDTFRSDLLSLPSDGRLFELTIESQVPAGDIETLANEAVGSGAYDAVVYFPESFANNVKDLTESSEEKRADIASTAESNSSSTDRRSDQQNLSEEGGPEVFFNQAKDKSRVARDRVVAILTRWRTQVVDQTLSEKSLPANMARPFLVVSQDLSAPTGRTAAAWSKILPFIIIIWAMTGAFYPAVDLCAGEKERGTLETLLSCPASRHEIVLGKLVTVMLFSIATSLLNLFSLTFTGRFVMAQLHSYGSLEGLEIGPPPLNTIVWLFAALIPISALFSALSLALAAMARSSKEGQYYLMPLMLGTMPLMMLPMLPAVELDLGNSLVPVSGIILLLRNLIEGEYAEALKYSIPVIAVTTICCWLAVLWAIHQFQDENVLFHESEQFSLRAWLVHLIRDRDDVPTIAQAFLCAVTVLILRFFSSTVLPVAADWQSLLWQNIVSQVALIAGPAVLMAVLLTKRPATTLLLRRPQWSHLLLAGLLAVAMHPVVSTFANGIRWLYPISEQTMEKLEAFQTMLAGAPNIWALLLMVAVFPAICEELAFRGFVLSGLRRMKNQALAILVSSLFFGIAHQMLQQSIAAFAVGMLIGFVSIKSNSILPCMFYHLIHNSLPLLAAYWIEELGGVAGFVELDNGGLVYGWPIVSVCIAAALAILLRFGNHPKVGTPNVVTSRPPAVSAPRA